MKYDANNQFLFQVDLLIPNTRPYYTKEVSRAEYDTLLDLQKRIPIEVFIETLASQNLGLVEAFQEAQKIAQQNDMSNLINEKDYAEVEIIEKIGLILYGAASLLGALSRKDGTVNFFTEQNIHKDKVAHEKEFNDKDKEFLRSLKIDTEEKK